MMKEWCHLDISVMFIWQKSARTAKAWIAAPEFSPKVTLSLFRLVLQASYKRSSER